VGKTYIAWGRVDAGVFLGEFEAKDADAAREEAEKNCHPPSICHQCSKEIDIGDIYQIDIEEK